MSTFLAGDAAGTNLPDKCRYDGYNLAFPELPRERLAVLDVLDRVTALLGGLVAVKSRKVPCMMVTVPQHLILYFARDGGSRFDGVDSYIGALKLIYGQFRPAGLFRRVNS